ncbi:hypothetical protein KR059_003656 [Drosophila kikkawai]|nr:hypothetical protein KR059_003656 [Drosophila kikkawai]
MESITQENNKSSSVSANSPVINISGKVEPKQSPTRGKKKPVSAPPPPEPVIAVAPKINPATFPVISSRILLKADVPPAAVPRINPSDFDQYLCFLCLDKPATRKRVYHMYLSNEKDLERDTERVRKMYDNKKDLKIVDRTFMVTLCARSLCHRVQKKLTDVTWNKQKNIFETDWIGERDVWNLSEKIYKLQYEELAKFFNYIKFLSATNS